MPNQDHYKKHGDSYTRLYKIWTGIRYRCDNSNNHHYHNYGGRGITYYPDWGSYFEFKKWALSHGYTDELTIERENNDGNYCPDNCSWIPKSEQGANRRGWRKSRSKYRGVDYLKNAHKWRARLYHKGVQHYIGNKFNTEDEAYQARREFINSHGFDITI